MRFPMWGSSVMRLPCGGAFRPKQTKRAEPFVCLLETEGSAKPVKPNKQQTTHALWTRAIHSLFLFYFKFADSQFKNKSGSSDYYLYDKITIIFA